MMTDEECRIRLQNFIATIRRLGDPIRVEAVAQLIEQQIFDRSYPKHEIQLTSLLNQYQQEAMGIHESAATLTLYLGAD